VFAHDRSQLRHSDRRSAARLRSLSSYRLSFGHCSGRCVQRQTPYSFARQRLIGVATFSGDGALVVRRCESFARCRHPEINRERMELAANDSNYSVFVSAASMFHVDVFERAVPFELARLDLLLDCTQPVLNFAALSGCYDSRARERSGVSDRPCDFNTDKATNRTRRIRCSAARSCCALLKRPFRIVNRRPNCALQLRRHIWRVLEETCEFRE
jgi:hypothetical protein